MDRRRLLRAAFAALPVSALAGCLAGGADSAHTWWELETRGPDGSAVAHRARARKSLVVEGIAAGALYDGTALLYSRAPGVRSPYQYASWTERPAMRLARLAQRRLQQRGGFRDVSTADAGVAPDLLLSLTLERLYHDLSVEPGVLQLLVNATLTDWHSRRPIESRQFSVSEPVESKDAAGAAAAAGRAAGLMLDALAPWVEALAAAHEPGPGRQAGPQAVAGGGEGRRDAAPGKRRPPAARGRPDAGGATRPAIGNDGRTTGR